MSLQTASYYKAFFSHTVYSFVQCVVDLGRVSACPAAGTVSGGACAKGPWGRVGTQPPWCVRLRITGSRAEDTIVLGTALLLSIL
jgi:hypothetical protein